MSIHNLKNSSQHQKLSKTIWVLGFVSMLMDVSSEIIHGLLPVFLVSVLNSSYATVGMIEGIGEGVALFFKTVSGTISDRFQNRKFFVLAGYFIAAVSKPIFAFAHTAEHVLFARISDRVGKGIRGAPRDALIADITPVELRGRAYGLRQSLDTVGAFLGPMIAIALMYATKNNYRLIFAVAIIPAALAVLLIAFGVKEPNEKSAIGKNFTFSEVKNFSRYFWIVVLCGSFLQFAKFSEAFLILKAKEIGLSLMMSPMILIAMNIVYSALAYPIGILSDRIHRRHLLSLGFAMLFIADLVFAKAQAMSFVFIGCFLWGLHLALTQGVLASLVADTCPKQYRGTAFGIFNFCSALALLTGNPVAGLLWDRYGSQTTFLFSAVLTCIGIVIFVLFTRRLEFPRD